MNVDREGVLRQIEAGQLSYTKAAKILGISRQRVGRIIADRRKLKMPSPSPKPAAPAPADVQPPPADPAPPAAGGVPPERRNELEELLRKADAGPLGAPPTSPPPPVPPGPAVDPREAEAGKELSKMLTSNVGVLLASKVYKVNATDPRLAALRKPNRFLELSLDLNQDKTAVLGRWAGGWKGLGIGILIELARAVWTCEDLGLDPAASVATGAAPPEPPAGPVESDEGEVVDSGGFSISRAKSEARGE